MSKQKPFKFHFGLFTLTQLHGLMIQINKINYYKYTWFAFVFLPRFWSDKLISLLTYGWIKQKYITQRMEMFDLEKVGLIYAYFLSKILKNIETLCQNA